MKQIFSTLVSAIYLIALVSMEATSQNPFFSTYTTPFGVPPFTQIKNEHFEPAFIEGMKQQAAEIAAITAQKEAPTFANTILALENSGDLMDRVGTVFFNFNNANTNDGLQKIAQTLSPRLSKHRDDIQLNAELFKRVKAVYDQRNSLKLTGEQKMLLEKTYKNFVRSGAALSAEKQERMRKINTEMSLLTLKFGQNLLAENNSYTLVIEKPEDLSGLPASLIAAAADDAKKRKMEGKWVFTLQNPSIMPFLQYADNRALREKIFKAYLERGNHNDAYDNKALMTNIVALRAEKAALLGYENHAAYVLEESMAQTPAKVSALLNQLWTATVPVTKQEAAELQTMMDKDGRNEKLESWDWRYYAEKLRKQKYDLKEEELRPYFSLDNVRQGIFTLCQRLYGLKFEPRADIPVPRGGYGV